MKKISQIEKNAILEMHSKLKKPLIYDILITYSPFLSFAMIKDVL